MKLLRTATVLVLSVFALTACDDDATSVEIADLAGMWNATQFEYSDAENTAFAVDAITLVEGSSVTLDVEESGSFSGTIRVPGLTVDPTTGETITIPLSGTLSVDGNLLNVEFDQQTLAITCPTEEQCLFESFVATFELSGDVLTFRNADTTFDFPDTIEAATPGVEVRGAVPAILEARFER